MKKLIPNCEKLLKYKKFIISFALICLSFIFYTVSFADAGDTGSYMGFSYIVTNNLKATVTGYTGSETNVVIPDEFDGYTVSAIGNAAFQDKKQIESITLPETITSINDVNAFWYCISLKSINLPDSLTYLGIGAFSGCSSLEEIKVPEGITTLSKTFRGCTSLKKVYIPDSVTSIDNDTFLPKVGGTGLISGFTIYCNEGSYAQQYAESNGINCVVNEKPVELTYVANSDGDNTVTVTGVKDGKLIKGDYVLPQQIDGYTVTRIEKEAFLNQTEMTSFVMPNTVKEISYSVFWACTNLKSVSLSENLSGALNGTFAYCSNLEKVNIPKGITSLRKTFLACKSLKKISLPGNINVIDTLTFQSCIALKTINFPDSITSIADDAFLYCSTSQITAYLNSLNSYSATVAKNLNMICLLTSEMPYVIENREVSIVNGKPNIGIELKNINYTDKAKIFVAIYEKVCSDEIISSLYDVSVRDIQIASGTTEKLSFDFEKDYIENLTYKVIITDDSIAPLLNTVERVLVDKDEDIDKYAKMNLFESNSSSSSWDKALTTNFGVTGWANVAINDNFNNLPCEAYRSFPEIVDEVVTLDFDFSLSKYMENTKFCVFDNENTIVGFVTKDTHLYLEQPGGNDIQLAEYTPYKQPSNEEEKCYVRVEFDLKNGIINYVRVNGDIVATKVPLTNLSNRIDGFDILTGIEATGYLINRQVRINCDYIVNEDFNNQFGILPKDWDYELNGSSTSVYEINSRIPDRFSVDVDTKNGDFRATKSFESQTGNLVFEYMVLQPVKREGINFSVKNGDKTIATVYTDGEDFVLKTDTCCEKFYNYSANVWYGIKLEVDLINSKLNVFVNNKNKLSEIAIDAHEYLANNVEIFAEKNENNFIFDDVKVYRQRIIPDNYVPEPIISETEKPFVMGMQVCNLWTEGQYNKSWDYVKSAPNRLPAFGPYDEGNPEMNDWEIKWLAEHGIDYENIWAYPNIKYSAGKGYQPIKPNVVREGHYIYDGFMNAEYSDKMKFTISFENSSANYSDEFCNEFFEAYVPYWIEYYFKDDRYLKIDGRPIIGIYSTDKFLGMFGTMGSEDDKINQGIARFRQMCIDAGVGNPYIISHGFGFAETTFQKYSVYDIDCIGLAAWPKYEGLTWQRYDIKKMATYANKYGMDFVTSLQPNQDLAAWDLQTGFHSSRDEFTDALVWARDTLPSQITSYSLSKKLMSFLTWNEYGEGHIFMPTKENGFTYLDCIRNTFVSKDAHTDVLPGEEQVKRINRMVDNDRLVTTVRENPVPWIPEDYSNLSVKKSWNFTTGDDYLAWQAYNSSCSISRQNGKLVVTANTGEPVINLKNVPNIDLYDVTYVKIRMKGNTSSCGGNVKWTTYFDSTFDDLKRTYIPSPTKLASNVYDYYVPIGQSVKRVGFLTGLQIMLGKITDKTQRFEIESIELLSDDTVTGFTRIKCGSDTVVTDNSPVYINDTLMVPLREVVTAMNGKAEWYAHDNSYIIYDGYSLTTKIKVGDKTAYICNIPYIMGEAPYCISDRINDAVYVPLDLICNALKIQIDWSENDNTLTIYTGRKQIADLLSSSQIIKAEYFNSVNYVTSSCSQSSNKRSLYGKSLSNDPNILFKTYFSGINTDDVNYIYVKLWSSVDTRMQLFFTLDGSTTLTSANSSKSYMIYRGMNTICVPVSQLNGWTSGTLNYLRLDPMETQGEFGVDYIALVK